MKMIFKRGLAIMKVSKINSFFLGAAKALDLGNTIRVFPFRRPRLPKKRQTCFQCDVQVLKNDWSMVGKDLQSAFHTFKMQHVRKP